MLLDLWEWFLLISDGIDLVFTNLASGTYPIPLSFLLATFFFTVISYFAWRSTDIPDLPPAPRPPYVIQLSAGPGSGPHRTIADVRLLSSGGFLDRSEIHSGFHPHNISRNQHQPTIIDRARTTTTTILRNASTTPSVPSGQPRVDVEQVIGRRSFARQFLLGLFNRRQNLSRPVSTPAVNAIRAQLNSPNVVVYHRVNVYHHHIHSHVGSGSGSNQNSVSNSTAGGGTGNSSQSQVNSSTSASEGSRSEEIPSTANTLAGTDISEPSSSTTTTTTTTHSSETSRLGDSGQTAVESDGNRNADASSAGNVDGLIFSSTSSSVQIDQRDNSNSSTNQSEVNMPARGSGNQSGGGGDGSGRNRTEQRHPVGGGGGADDVRFTIKFLNDTQMDVTSQLGEKIADFKRRHFSTEMSENKTVRLIFNGRVLDNENKTLRESGIFDQCVVHCLIVSRQQTQDRSRSGAGATAGTGHGAPGIGTGGGRNNNDTIMPGVQIRRLPEPGMFFVAFIGIFLIFLWFVCLHFGQHLFTQSAVVSLTVLTAIFLIGIVACYLPVPAN